VLYPDHVTLAADYRLESQQFVCGTCRREGCAVDTSARLIALQDRRAAQLRRCTLSDAIEAHLQETLRTLNINMGGLVVRVVSSRRFNYQALPLMKERYGPDYPDGFPYESRAIFAFQETEGVVWFRRGGCPS
jgi:hypothetical protein